MITKIINGIKCVQHHSATHRGYQTVKGNAIEKYNGRFGVGFKEHINDPRTTNYHTVIYWIEVNENE